MAVQVPVENIRLAEMLTDPKQFLRGNTKIGPVLEVKITKEFDRRGIEIKIDSMQKDGTQSWMVISRGVGKYVTELAVDHTKPFHYEEASSGTGQLVAMEERQQLFPSSSSSSTLPIKLRTWSDIPAVPKVIEDNCYDISKIMTRILRHGGYPREEYGAIEWRKQLPMFHRENPEVKKWTRQQEKISVLLGLQRKHSVHACHPRPLWRTQS